MLCDTHVSHHNTFNRVCPQQLIRNVETGPQNQVFVFSNLVSIQQQLCMDDWYFDKLLKELDS